MNQPSSDPGIYLGYPFDQLLDRNCDLEYWKSDPRRSRSFIPAIKLPHEGSPGTGNIVITGPPGSGKSTLGLQWAVKCPFRPDNLSNAACFSLEQTIDEVITKAKPFGWHRWVRPVRILAAADELGTADQAARSLWDLLKSSGGNGNGVARTDRASRVDSAEDGGDAARRVLLCSLSPRPVAQGTSHEELFWRRYAQLDRLLSAAEHLTKISRSCEAGIITGWEDLAERVRTRKVVREKSFSRGLMAHPAPDHIFLPVFVIDSLNMFGTRPLNREEMYRLFGLFRKYGRIGIFVVESTQETPFDSTMADVVIRLSNYKERGYYVQYFEIEKSRYYNQVNGLHPYKPSSLPPGETEDQHLTPPMPTSREPKPPRRGLVIYPSLHYVVLRTEQTGDEQLAREPLDEPLRFSIRAMGTLLPPLLRHSVITIEGQSGTYKTSIAMNFLAAGLHHGESGLLIRLSDIPLLQEDGSKKFSPRISRELAERHFHWAHWKQWLKEEKEGGYWSNLAARHKTTISVWRKGDQHFDRGDTAEPTLFELDFKSGALLPEEFVETIRDILNRRSDGNRRIRRVVFDDVGQIGASYPLLRQSLTSGDTFLSAFVHIMRNAGVDLVMIGTTTGLPQADEMVIRACSLADAVLSCSFCDVFGERHIIVRRKGLVTSKRDERGLDKASEPVPAVLRLFDTNSAAPNTFDLDQDYLAGLLGIESGKIYRPGLLINLFEDNDIIQHCYNQDLAAMLQAGFASGCKTQQSRDWQEDEEVKVVPFGPGRSESIHGAITSFHTQERPLERTVLFMVDEFGASLNQPETIKRQWALIDPGLKWAEFLVSTEPGDPCWQGYFWPYYCNVLLLAFRTDGLRRTRGPGPNSKWNPRTWRDVEKLAKAILSGREPLGDTPHEVKGRNWLPPIERGFWVDLRAAESLACLLLDTLHVANGRKGFAFLDNSAGHLTPEEQSELKSVVNLIQMSNARLPDDLQRTPDDSGVYVLWYSQLRELIECRPALGEKLSVCALPGGGFRGDWFLGVVRGSVNRELGQRIVNVICGPEEDNKRYVRGVALPARRAFYTKDFYAWPRGCHVTLADLEPIWKNASRRGQIKQYERIRSNIYALARQLTAIGGPIPESTDTMPLLNAVNIGRLYRQIALLRHLFSG